MDARGLTKRVFLFTALVATISALATARGALAWEDMHGEKNDEHSHDPRVRRGYEIAPVPLDLRGRNRALVGLGSYLVNAVASCNDCHTSPPFAPGGNPFAGEPKVIDSAHYLAGGTPFGPPLTPPGVTVVSANITPDDSGRPAGLSFEEFMSAIRTGVDPDDGHILQVMPWPILREMTDRDLAAIYEYLSAIPHAEPGP